MNEFVNSIQGQLMHVLFFLFIQELVHTSAQTVIWLL